jgi:uncharacterized protein (DUF169 family)
MTEPGFPDVYRRYVAAFGVPEMQDLVAVGIRFVRRGEAAPAQAQPLDKAYTWCHAVKEASKGKVVLVDRDTVGCAMAAIALGLVDENDAAPLAGWRQYSQNMRTQPAPRDYKAGTVFGCMAAGRPDFALYGADDTGRFPTIAAAQRAFEEVPKIQPACMSAVVAFPPHDDLSDITPDTVVLALTPRETLRTVQGLTYATGERLVASTLGVAGLCGDLTAYPYVAGRANASFFCVGARILGRWEGGLNGLGLPWRTFVATVEGMEASRTGYPFSRYPA